MAATSEYSLVGRAPMKVPLPTWRHNSPLLSIAARALRSSPRETPRMSQSSRSGGRRSEEHTSELQSLMRISYAVFCLKKKKKAQSKTKIYKYVDEIWTTQQ